MADDPNLPATTPDRDLEALVDFGKEALTAYRETAAIKAESEKNRHAYDKEYLRSEFTARKHRAAYIGLVTFAILLIASGLIFFQKDLNAGMLILSHVGAIVAGAFGGWGWERGRKKE